MKLEVWVQWTGMGESVVTTCWLASRVAEHRDHFPFTYSGSLGTLFIPTLASLFPTSGLAMTIYCYMDLVLRILATLPRGNPSSLTPAVSSPLSMSGKFLRQKLCFPRTGPRPHSGISPQGASLSPSRFLPQGCRSRFARSKDHVMLQEL